MKRLVGFVVLVAIASAACSNGGAPKLRLGVRAVALDLAFSNPKLAVPVEPEHIIRVIPAPPEVASGAVPLTAFKPAPALRPLCATAAADASVRKQATLGIFGPPAAGRYPRHNTGTFGISAGQLNLTLPYPPITRDDVDAAIEVEQPPPYDLGGPGKPRPGSGVFEWNVVNTVTAEFVVTTRYRVTSAALQMVEQTTQTGEGSRTFTPAPPISILELGQGVGHAWRSAGVDTDTRTAMVFDAKITTKSVVDACGTLVDAFRVEANETFVDLTNGQTSGTDSGNPNVYDIATQFGGLIARAEIHVTQALRDEASGTPLVLTFNYVSTIDSPEPVK